jgi:peptide/nickel transport system substrate-binding protein
MISNKKKWFALIALMAIASLVLAACQCAQKPPAGETPEAGGTTGDKVYKVGVFEDATSVNFWAANGPDNTVWNSYMLPPRLAMYGLSDKLFEFVPIAAKDLPDPLTQEGDMWVVEIPMREDIKWSDGTPFTAEDVAFTANAVLELGLISGNWSSWYDANYLDHVEAASTYVVKYYYHTKPGLARHEYGTLQGPVLSKAFWEGAVKEAMAPIDALGASPSDEDLLAAQGEAHDILFAASADGEPLAGSFLFSKWEQGAFIENPANPDYFNSGVMVTMYSDGTYKEEPGTTLYGEGTGDVEVQYTVGPNVIKTVYSIYSSQDAAILALQDGDVDVILHPLGLQRGLQERVEGDPNLTVLENPTNGFRYMAFNCRRAPMSDVAFRQAVAILIDKEFVTQTILQGVAFPLYSFIPEANEAWYFNDVPKLGLHEDGTGMTREERINAAVKLLEDAGYKWEGGVKPTWDDEGGFVSPGGNLIMPDGKPVEELNLWAPAAGYDPLRSTFAIWIESWLNEAGIPVKAHLAGFNVLIPIIFTEQDFDMYILGWSLSVFPSYMRDFWHSEQAVPDGNNAAGYMNPEFDKLSEELMTCTNFDDCKQITDQLQIMLSTEVPYVVLFDTGIIEPYRSASVTYPYTQVLSGLQYMHQGGGTLQAEVNVK